MKINTFLCMLAFVCLSLSASAQRNCGSMDVLEQQLIKDPKRSDKMKAIEQQTQQFIANPLKAVNGVVSIPVVFHVVYRTAAENISDAQIQSQLTVLNDDFRRLNSDADGTWSQAADVQIEFCMATVDPNGNATNGTTRTSTTRTSFGTNDSVKSSSTGGKDPWSTADYLNIWVCNIGGGILGYAQFPGGNPTTDGVVNDYRYTGTIGTATAPFNLGRTLTHEVGHYLNLRHIWGDGNCNADDFVTDTPTSDAPNYGCAVGHVSCSSTDMVQNYMDYSDDGCMNLFTSGQKSRMRAIFDTGGARESLLNSGGCGNAPPAATCDDGIQNGNETGVDCGGSNCAPCPCNGTFVNVSITLDNYPEETSWTITADGGLVVASGGTYGSQPDGSTVTLDICLPDGCYDFQINDAYGDGICCSYGNGSYSVTDDGNTLASGSTFTTSETTNFCVSGGGGPTPTCTDGIQNGNETGVDCGGSDCAPCPTCNDGVQNGNETGVDCGGSDCTPCPTCSDGIQNGNETGVDCGGPDCATCPPTCNDGIQNGNETGVDCGGSNCAPCPCNGTVVNVSITLDNYPEETSWTITANGGTVVASGGTYGNQPDGSTVATDICLPDGCYDFQINDAFGDGICCSYGNGSYSVTGGGNTLASGSTFTTSETTNFCLGGGGPTTTCTDGIQNGNETGVDCGGPDCAPCNNGGCATVNINNSNFDSGWGIWNDGGSDCRRSINDATFANSGNFCIRLRDNTSSSVMTTDNLNLAGFEEVTVDFSYIANSMENGEDFWLQVSLNGGSSYQTLTTYASGTDFANNVRENTSVVVTGTFTSTTRFRFRCDASNNADYVYIDDVVLTGCANGNRDDGSTNPNEEIAVAPSEIEPITPKGISAVNLFPNPTIDKLNVAYHIDEAAEVYLTIVDLSGKVLTQQQVDVEAGKQRFELNVSNLNAGIYLLQIVTKDSRVMKKFVVAK